MNPVRLLARATNTAVLWHWIFNILRLSSSLLLLPLLLHTLSEHDFGMYIVFLCLTAIIPVLDFGLAPNIERNVAYAMAGVQDLQPLGLSDVPGTGKPNVPLLWNLFRAVRSLYRRLALAGFLILGVVGTWAVSVHVAETDWPIGTWIAWCITLGAGTLELYLGWWANFLTGMNQPLAAARIAAAGYFVYLFLAAILLKAGFGLISVPVASLVSSILQRTFNRRASLRLLRAMPDQAAGSDNLDLLRTLWPNIWRMGCLLLANYVAVNLIIFLRKFDLAANAQYGLSLRLVAAAQTIAAVWVYVKWPKVAQLNSLGDTIAIRAILQPRFWLQTITFLTLSFCLVAVGPRLLRSFFPDKQLLPGLWLGLMVVNSFFQMSFTFWTTLLWMQNRIPSFIPTIVTQIATLALLAILVSRSHLGAAAFVVAPLICGAVFNYWFWWGEGARMLKTTVPGFLFRKSESSL
jgi:O-antigen/teichoic acid export membrane protein